MPGPDLKDRLAKWRPPKIDPKRKPGGLAARKFPASVRAIRGGGFRPGYRK